MRRTLEIAIHRVLTTPRKINEELARLTQRTSVCIDEHFRTVGAKTGPPIGQGIHVELIIIDESKRLNSTALEVLRDKHHRNNTALGLIGMPGAEKQFSRNPAALQQGRIRSRILTARQGTTALCPATTMAHTRTGPSSGGFTEAQAVAAIARITRGNFRLIDRPLTQIQRVMKINRLSTITDDVVEARSTLVIGIR